MLRIIGFIGILCALVIVGMSWARQSFQTAEKAPTAVLQAATVVLELNHRTTGTYAGTRPGSVTVVSADAGSYCIEHGGWFVAGPGGTPMSGSCPRDVTLGATSEAK
jgi:hypothetical protein